jgi:hypothetical protein
VKIAGDGSLKIQMGTTMTKIQVLDTDIEKYKNPQDTNKIIQNWLRNRNTIEFLGIWEKINKRNDYALFKN